MSRLQRATPAARVWALLLDGVQLLVVALVVMLLAYLLSSPGWNLKDAGYVNQISGGAGAEGGSTVPSWLSWVVLLALLVAAVGLSGAFKASGRRRSLGMAVAGLALVRVAAESLTPDQVSASWQPAEAEPARWRVAARWLLPVGVFAALVPVFGGWPAPALVALALWTPAVWGPRRSVYDLVLGVTVVDAADLAGLGSEARALARELDP